MIDRRCCPKFFSSRPHIHSGSKKEDLFFKKRERSFDTKRNALQNYGRHFQMKMDNS